MKDENTIFTYDKGKQIIRFLKHFFRKNLSVSNILLMRASDCIIRKI